MRDANVFVLVLITWAVFKLAPLRVTVLHECLPAGYCSTTVSVKPFWKVER